MSAGRGVVGLGGLEVVGVELEGEEEEREGEAICSVKTGDRGASVEGETMLCG